MLPTNTDPDEVIRRTAPVLVAVYKAFEAAAITSLEFFAPKRGRRKRGPIDPETVNSSVFSALVRYYVRLALNEKGLDTSEEDFTGVDPLDVPYDLENLPNNGLLLKYAGCQLRIRKKYYGKLPNPATSTLQDFYQQSLPFGPMLVDGDEVPPPLKLMILWNCDSHYHFSGLDLVLPTDGGPKFSEWEWKRKVPHPATLIAGKTQDEDEDELPFDTGKKKGTGTDPSDND
jgi:hypothetical protein